MSNLDKNIGIFPNTGAGSGILPEIRFVGSGNDPISLYVNDDNSLSFKTVGGKQVFNINHNGISAPTGVISVIDTSLVDGGNF